MICYKDMTFCTAACKKHSCRRYLSAEVLEGAKKWWGGEDAPVAMSDFSETCKEYEPGGSSAVVVRHVKVNDAC